jgi:predicted AlkP superfamily phosphohydrolase/phosphomutase
MSINKKPKVAMLGFDAAELGYILEFLHVMPNFKRALSCGALSRLDSPAYAMPGSVWPTFYSATPPGEHGIHHMMQWDASAMRLRRVSDAWLYCEPFWRELERRGLKVIVLDVPMTFPPSRCAGVEVSSWGAHDQLTPFSAYPKELKGEIPRRFGEHPMGLEIPVEKSIGERVHVRDALVEGIRTKSEMIRWLMTSREWDFFISVFGESHRGGHILWPDGDGDEAKVLAGAVLDVYRALDRGLGEVLSAINLEETTVIIFSLHGMGENLSQEHFVPLMMDRVNAKYSEIEPGLFESGRPPEQRSLMRLLRQKVPPWLQSRIANMVPQRVRDAVVDRSLTAGYDWSRTPGFALLADDSGYLRFNFAGRESQGMLERGSASYARYSEFVVESFNSLRTPHGEPIVKDIYFAGDQFPGIRADYLPDLIVTWSGLEPASRADSRLGILAGELATGRGGNHRPQGFQIVMQPGVERGGETRPSSIADVAPMVLRWFDNN